MTTRLTIPDAQTGAVELPGIAPDCAEALNFIYSRLDGPLPAGDDLRLRQHLVGCPECAAESASAQIWNDGLSGLELEGYTPARAEQLVRRTMAAVRQEAAPAVPVAAPAGWAFALQAGLLAFVFGGLSWLAFAGGVEGAGAAHDSIIMRNLGYFHAGVRHLDETLAMSRLMSATAQHEALAVLTAVVAATLAWMWVSAGAAVRAPGGTETA